MSVGSCRPFGCAALAVRRRRACRRSVCRRAAIFNLRAGFPFECGGDRCGRGGSWRRGGRSVRALLIGCRRERSRSRKGPDLLLGHEPEFQVAAGGPAGLFPKAEGHGGNLFLAAWGVLSD